MIARCVVGCMLIGLTAATRMDPLPAPVLWAWERPEDLRFAGPEVTIAVLAGTVWLSARGVSVRPRLQPAVVLASQRVVGVVHVEIDRVSPPDWTVEQRAETAAVVLALLKNPRFVAAQIDFEVRASRRQVLLDVLTDVRAGLPAGHRLSMTALASWCDTETWIEAAPVDEVVPMLFRMGHGGEAIRRRLGDGGDFRQARCRTSIGIATDTPPDGLPADGWPVGRTVWIFDPRAWTADDLVSVRDRLGR